MPIIIPGNRLASTGYAIDQSIRFNSADSAYMSRTPSSTGNRKTFTSSFWVKLGDLTDCSLPMPSVSQSANYGAFLSSGIIQFFIYYTGSSWQGQLYTNRVFRDPSAWYHFVIVVDTTQAISTERVRIYINGQRETSFSTENYPNQNQDTDWNNSGEAMGVGVNAASFSGSFGEYYAAEMHYLDGYAYGPEYFGETNDSGIWIPKEYTGSYGTNGFKIDGRDSSDLGDDESGNGNDFTTSGLASHDQVLDSPTNNFAVMNPLADYYANHTFKNGNLELLTSTTTNQYTYSINNIGMSSGKWYAEMYVGSIAGQCLIGISDRQSQGGTHYLGSQSYEYSWYSYNGKSINGGTQSTFASTYTTNDIIGVALDLDNSKLYFSKNGSFVNSGDPTSGSTGTGAISITAVGSTQNGHYFFAVGDYSNAGQITVYWNFGQEGTFAGNTTAGGNSDSNGVGNFKYSVPSGYLALCTKNLGS